MRAFASVACLSLVAASAWAAPGASADYWRLGPYYRPQVSDSACSVASVAMALAALGAGGVDQATLLVSDGAWRSRTAPGGEGVSFFQLVNHLRAALRRTGLDDADITIFHPIRASDTDLALLRSLLTAAAGDARDVVLVTFDQGWLWGEASVGHVSPLGDYDAASGRVLLMDVDGAHFGAVWISDTDLLAAMTRADADDPDGVIVIRRR